MTSVPGRPAPGPPLSRAIARFMSRTGYHTLRYDDQFASYDAGNGTPKEVITCTRHTDGILDGCKRAGALALGSRRERAGGRLGCRWMLVGNLDWQREGNCAWRSPPAPCQRVAAPKRAPMLGRQSAGPSIGTRAACS